MSTFNNDKPDFRGAEPAYPLAWAQTLPAGQGLGLSKRELAAIELRVPDTGDPEIDALIRSARRADFAGMAMQGIAASSCDRDADPDFTAKHAVRLADALLAELERGR